MENITTAAIELMNQDGQILASSRQIAENFGKKHKHVLDAIENLVAEKSAAKFFYKTSYENRGKQYPEYLMNRDGFSLLIMGFNGAEALAWKVKYIEAFNAMEQQLKTMAMDSYMIADPVSRATKWIEEEKRRQALATKVEESEETIKLLEPKAALADRLAGTKDWLTMEEAAKALAYKGYGRNNLFRLLKDRGILLDSKHPQQRYINSGYFKIIMTPYYNEYVGEQRTSLQVKVSQRGIKAIDRLIRADIQTKAETVA